MVSFVEEFYGLSRSPFPTRGETGSVLLTEPLREITQEIKQSIGNGAEVVCIDGVAGIGKTSLFRALPGLLQDEFQVALLRDFSRPWDHMIDTIVRELQLDGGVVSRSSLAAARARGRRLVLAIDDAEQISSKALDRICVLSQLLGDDDEPLIRVILFADLVRAGRASESPLLFAWLDSEHLHTLRCLPEERMHTYLHARLRRAGWRGEPLFSRDAARILHRCSSGNPRRLSAACIELMERAAARGLSQIPPEFVFEVLGSRFDRRRIPARPRPVRAGFDTAASGKPSGKQGSALGNRADDLHQRPLTAESIINSPSLDLREPLPRPTAEVKEAEREGHPRAAATPEPARVTPDPIAELVSGKTGWSRAKRAALISATLALAFYAGRAELAAIHHWASTVSAPAAAEVTPPARPGPSRDRASEVPRRVGVKGSSSPAPVKSAV
jgi:type II secretory pathway predicted ATPase ExeA